jgi:transcriptional regulator with XRE-family HTH domain
MILVPVESTIGSRIDVAREQLGLTLDQVAHRAGVKSETLENWLQGRTEPRADKLMRLTGVLQVPLAWLLTGDMPEGADFDPTMPATATIARRLERAVAMQQELAALLIDISADITRLQRDLETDARLAA